MNKCVEKVLSSNSIYKIMDDNLINARDELCLEGVVWQVYLAFLVSADKNGLCKVSLDTIRDIAMVSKRSIFSAIKALTDMKILTSLEGKRKLVRDREGFIVYSEPKQYKLSCIVAMTNNTIAQDIENPVQSISTESAKSVQTGTDKDNTIIQEYSNTSNTKEKKEEEKIKEEERKENITLESKQTNPIFDIFNERDMKLKTTKAKTYLNQSNLDDVSFARLITILKQSKIASELETGLNELKNSLKTNPKPNTLSRVIKTDITYDEAKAIIKRECANIVGSNLFVYCQDYDAEKPFAFEDEAEAKEAFNSISSRAGVERWMNDIIKQIKIQQNNATLKASNQWRAY